MNEILRTEELVFGYENGFSSKPLNISVDKGDLIVLMGRNGEGKTTLLKTLVGNLWAQSGSIFFEQKNISDMNVLEKAKVFSYVSSSLNVDVEISVYEFLKFARYPHVGMIAQYSDKDFSIIEDVLDFLKIKTLRDRKVTELSDGQKKRVLIARALVQETPLIIMDEPSAHLDLPSKIEVMETLKKVCNELGKTVLIADHFWTMSLMFINQMWLMSDGAEVSVGAPEDFLLSGKIDETLSSEDHHISLETGSFVPKEEMSTNYSIEGDKLSAHWCSHYLAKCGINPSDIKIKIEDGAYIVDDKKYSSLLELQRSLKLS